MREHQPFLTKGVASVDVLPASAAEIEQLSCPKILRQTGSGSGFHQGDIGRIYDAIAVYILAEIGGRCRLSTLYLRLSNV
jgi:hypothetical protein